MYLNTSRSSPLRGILYICFARGYSVDAKKCGTSDYVHPLGPPLVVATPCGQRALKPCLAHSEIIKSERNIYPLYNSYVKVF